MAGEISSSDSEYCAAHGTVRIARQHPSSVATSFIVVCGSASPKVGIHHASKTQVRMVPKIEIGLRSCTLSEIIPTMTSAMMLPPQNHEHIAAASPGV